MRRIKKLEVTALALCKRGKNRLPGLYKSEDGGVEILTSIVKSDEKGELAALVYAPELPDSDSDIASREVIRQAAHHFMRSGAALDVEHDGKKLTRDQAYVAESFVVQKSDPRFQNATDRDGNAVDAEGAWGVIVKIDDPALRKMYREEGWNGVSLFAPADKVQFETAKSESTVVDALVNLLRKHDHEETEMDETKIKTLLTENNVALSKAIVEGITAAFAPKPPTEKSEEEKGLEKSKLSAPKFKGDPFDVKAVREHAKALQRHKLVSEVDWNDPESIEAGAARLEEAGLAAGGGDQPSDSAKSEIERLQGEITRLRRSSNQPISKTEDHAPIGVQGLSKSDSDALAAGRAAGSEFNKAMGWGK